MCPAVIVSAAPYPGMIGNANAKKTLASMGRIGNKDMKQEGYMQSQLQPARWLLLFGLAVSLVTAFLMPPLNVLDGFAHWYRTVQISQGQLIPETLQDNWLGGPIPADAAKLADLMREAKNTGKPLSGDAVRRWSRALYNQPGKPEDLQFSNTATIPPLAYVPGAFGVWLGRVLGLEILDQMFLARIMNALAFYMIILLAVRVLPDMQFGLAALATAPAFLFMAASVSGDPMNFSLPVLWLAWCWRLATKEDPLNMTERIGIGACFLALALLKTPMILFAAFAMLIPASRFSPAGRSSSAPARIGNIVLPAWLPLQGNRVLHLFVLGLPALVFWFSWRLNIHFEAGRYANWPSDPQAVTSYILHHPFAAWLNIWHNLIDNIWHKFILSLLFTGGYGNGFHSPVPTIISYLVLGMMFWSALATRKPMRSVFAVLLLFAVSLLFGLALYAGFWQAMNLPDATQIKGVQPRYFWPIWFFLFLAFGWLAGRRLPLPQPGAGAVIFVCAISLGGWMLAVSHYQQLWFW